VSRLFSSVDRGVFVSESFGTLTFFLGFSGILADREIRISFPGSQSVRGFAARSSRVQTLLKQEWFFSPTDSCDAAPAADRRRKVSPPIETPWLTCCRCSALIAGVHSFSLVERRDALFFWVRLHGLPAFLVSLPSRNKQVPIIQFFICRRGSPAAPGPPSIAGLGFVFGSFTCGENLYSFRSSTPFVSFCLSLARHLLRSCAEPPIPLVFPLFFPEPYLLVTDKRNVLFHRFRAIFTQSITGCRS